MNRYRVAANFPSLKAHEAYQVVHVEARDWYHALRLAAIKLRQLPVLKRRHIHNFSLTVHLEGHINLNEPDDLQMKMVEDE